MNRSLVLPFLRACPVLSVLAVALLLPLPAVAQVPEVAVAQAVARETRCPVCGMYPARYPKWMAQVAFSDRTTLAFDSPLDLFRFLGNMAKYDRRHSRADVAAIFLSDHARGGWIEARRAFLVVGSTARGPMNNADLPAFGSREAAEAFVKSSGGKVLAFDQVTPTPEGLKALEALAIPETPEIPAVPAGARVSKAPSGSEHDHPGHQAHEGHEGH